LLFREGTLDQLFPRRVCFQTLEVFNRQTPVLQAGPLFIENREKSSTYFVIMSDSEDPSVAPGSASESEDQFSVCAMMCIVLMYQDVGWGTQSNSGR